MLNETDLSFSVEEEDNFNTSKVYSDLPDEASYSIFFSSFNPSSPVFTNSNVSDFGVSIGMFKFCLEGVGINLLSAMGIVGNILSIIVLSSPRMRNPSSLFLLCLSVCDILTLITSVILVGIPSILIYHPEGDTLFVFNENIMTYVSFIPTGPIFAIACTVLSASIFFTIALTLERYLAVCKPFIARHLCTWSKAGFISGIIIILSIVYNLPRWWEFYSGLQETSNNLTFYRPLPTAMRTHPVYDTYYVHVTYFVLQFFAPVCILIIFNILIYREIREANKLRKTMSPIQRHENSLTFMLFGVCAVFLFCQLSPALLMLYRYAAGSREFFPELQTFVCFTVVLNSSVNFLIYCTAGAKFREIFCDTFSAGRKSQEKFRQFARSTKTTFRSLSISSRSRAYSIKQSANNNSRNSQDSGKSLFNSLTHIV